MPQIAIFMIAAILLACVFVAVKWVNRRANYEAHEAQVSWKDATKVQELMSLYLDVLLMHGPDSREAKAFRFGVGNSEFWKDSDALKTYGTMIDICDAAVRRHKSWKKKK